MAARRAARARALQRRGLTRPRTRPCRRSSPATCWRQCARPRAPRTTAARAGGKRGDTGRAGVAPGEERRRAHVRRRAPPVVVHAPRTHLLELIRHEVHDQRKVLHFGALVADVVNACARGERGCRGRARAAEEAGEERRRAGGTQRRAAPPPRPPRARTDLALGHAAAVARLDVRLVLAVAVAARRSPLRVRGRGGKDGGRRWGDENRTSARPCA